MPVLRPNANYVNFTTADLPFLNGWAMVRWEGSASLLVSSEVSFIAAAPSPCLLVCNRPSTEKLSSVQISAVEPARDFRLPVTINRYRQTALALVNPSTVDTIRIKITILDASGESPKLSVPDTFEISIGPMERVSKFLWQMAQEQLAVTVIIPPPEQYQGSVRLTSSSRFAVGALNIMFPEGKFAAIPVFSAVP
jgi:hypothetical protein